MSKVFFSENFWGILVTNFDFQIQYNSTIPLNLRKSTWKIVQNWSKYLKKIYNLSKKNPLMFGSKYGLFICQNFKISFH